MRHTTQEVAAAWARGESAKGSSALTTDGRVLRSYHATIAVREVMPNGEVYFYLSTRKWSTTTSKHQTYASRAAADFGGSRIDVGSTECEEIAGKYAGQHRYDIRRYYADMNRNSRKIKGDLNLAQAQAHCNDPSTRKEGVYFDGYTEV